MFKEMQMNFQQTSSFKTCSCFENMQCKLKYFLRCSGKNLHSTACHLFKKFPRKINAALWMWKRMWIVWITKSLIVLSGSGISSSQYHKYIIFTIKYRNMQPVMDFPTHYLYISSFYTFRSCGFLSWVMMILNGYLENNKRA